VETGLERKEEGRGEHTEKRGHDWGVPLRDPKANGMDKGDGGYQPSFITISNLNPRGILVRSFLKKKVRWTALTVHKNGIRKTRKGKRSSSILWLTAHPPCFLGGELRKKKRHYSLKPSGSLPRRR